MYEALRGTLRSKYYIVIHSQSNNNNAKISVTYEERKKEIFKWVDLMLSGFTTSFEKLIVLLPLQDRVRWLSANI